MALLLAGLATLAAWLVYDRTRDGSITRSETTPDARSGASAASPAVPGAPPVPYRLVGTSSEGGAVQYLLARDDRVIPVTVGAALDGVYRVESAGEREVALVHVATGFRHIVSQAMTPWPPQGEAVAPGRQPSKPGPLPPAVQRTDSPALRELSR